ncbi:MAG: hypothetical protein JWM64_1763, partial [Frankiales bacterium]|nr:hypothetical protein [Frankiales bacterium]
TGASSSTGGAAGGGTGASGTKGAAPAAGTTGGQAAPAPGAPTGTLLLGNVGDYSGLSSSSTAGGLRGVQVWVQAVNAKGGISGRKVKLLVADAGGDGQRAKGFVQDFVESKKVTALVGSQAALSVNAWASYVDGKKVPAVGGECGAVYWNQHPMLFNQCPATETSLYGILANGVANKGKGAKWADLYCVESPDLCGKLDSLANQAGYAKKAGLAPVYRAGISLGQPDFTSECLNLRNSGAQVVSVFADANTTQRVARSCSQQNYKPVFLSGSIQAPSNAPTSAGLEDVELMVQTLPFSGVSTPAYAEYKAAVDKYGDGQTGVGEMNGWVAGKLFERAVELGGGTTTAQVVAGLLKMKRETLGGLSTPLTYLAGKPAPDSLCWYRMQAKGGKWTAPGGAKPSCWSGA